MRSSYKIQLASLLFLFSFGQFASAVERFDSLLSLSLEELVKVKVSAAGKTPKEIEEIPASVVILTQEEIVRYGYSDLKEVLNNIPGLYMTEDWAWFGSVNYGVRGVYSKGHFDNMMVQINGVSQMEDGKRGYPIEKINVPVAMIDRIEVIRGPMAVMYGSSAFLGVINIITNLNKNSQVSVSNGSHGTSKIVSSLSATEGDLSVVVNGGKQKTDGPDHRYRDMLSDPSVLEADWNLSENAKVALASENLYFDVSAEYKDFGVYIGRVEARSNVIDAQPGVGRGSLSSTEATSVSFQYNTKIDHIWNLKLSSGFFSNSYFLDEEYNFSGFFSNNQSKTRAQEYEINLIGEFDKLEALFGAYRRIGRYQAFDDYPTFDLPNREIMVDGEGVVTNALYSQLEYRLNNKVQLVSGVRAEQIESFKLIIYDNNIDPANPQELSAEIDNNGIRITPQLATIFRLNKNQNIKLLYSEGEKPASPTDNIANVELGITKLTPETAKSLELIYLFSSKDLFFQVGAFHNTINDLILRSSELINGEFVTTVGNIGKLTTFGLELNASANLSEKLKFNGDVSWHHAQDDTFGYDDIPVAYSPKVITNLRATYSVSPKLHVSVLGHYVHDVLAEWNVSGVGASVEERIASGSRSGELIEGYASFDLNFRWDDVWMDDVSLAFKVGNITDEEIRYPTINNRAFDRGTLGVGRHYLLTLSRLF